ncbi:hypothetical protein BRIN106911_02355 [Brevibacillus invocatus]
MQYCQPDRWYVLITRTCNDHEQYEQHQHQSKIVESKSVKYTTHSLSLLYRQLVILYVRIVNPDWTPAYMRARFWTHTLSADKKTWPHQAFGGALVALMSIGKNLNSYRPKKVMELAGSTLYPLWQRVLFFHHHLPKRNGSLNHRSSQQRDQDRTDRNRST